jgi:glycosidase
MGQKTDENIRRPMQWSANQYAGFSSHIPWEAVDQGYIQTNVQKEQGAFDSLLTTYQNLIHLRSSHPALSQGDYLPVASSKPEVYAFIRKDGSEILLMVVNLSRNSISDYSLSAQKIQFENGTYLVSDLQSGDKAAQFEVINGTISQFKPVDALQPYSGTFFTIVKQ